jgi:probable rRNA maturation factor
MAIDREIFISSNLDGLIYSELEICRMFKILDSSQFGIGDGELSLAFLSISEMCHLHGQFIGDSSLTDVLTFWGDEAMDFAGEICLSPDCALVNCAIHGTAFSDELCLYLVHGYLHLYGLDDGNAVEVEKMRRGEDFCMALLLKENSLPKFAYCPHKT